MLYRPLDGFGIDDTTLVKSLHDYAIAINMAKRAGNTAAMNALYEQFKDIANEYTSRGGTSAAILKMINQIHDAVIGTVEEVADVTGKTTANLLNPIKGILIPLALGLGALYLLPTILPKLKRRTT